MSFLPRFRRDFARLRKEKQWGVMRALVDFVLFDAGCQALAAYRVGSAFWRWKIPVVPALCRRVSVALCGVDILPSATIGGGCIIVHGVGLVVGGNTVVGEDCTLLQGVTLGEARFDRTDSPRLGDRVTIGAGAKVLGGIHVGHDAFIGAGSVVLEDVPPGATVAGVPAKIIKRQGTAE